MLFLFFEGIDIGKISGLWYLFEWKELSLRFSIDGKMVDCGVFFGDKIG